MLKVGLTGGIASGKSVVGEMFVALGAHLVQADRIAHSLMQPGEAVYNEVVKHFGRDILNPDMSINRAKLAEAAFGPATDDLGKRASRVEELNRIVHPVVIRSQDEWMQEMGRQDPNAVAIVEAALILEAGAKDHFDKLIVVTCDPEQRAARFAARQKIDLETRSQGSGPPHGRATSGCREGQGGGLCDRQLRRSRSHTRAGAASVGGTVP